MSAFLAPIAGAALSGVAGVLSRELAPKATKQQKQKEQLLDELLKSLSGEGQFSDLFNFDDAAFQQSFVNPAKHLFQSQIAPEIQQRFIAGGQQRGTGLDDTLTRAGVDLDQILNQQFAQMQQQAQQNQLSGISTVLGADAGLPAPRESAGNAFLAGVGGGAVKEFQDPLNQLFNRIGRTGFKGD